MSGGYLSCGTWMGDDKTASAFFEMIEDVEALVPPDKREEWEREFATPLRTQMDAQPEDDVPSFDLSPRMMEVLAPHVAMYFEQLRRRLGNPDPDTWFEIGEFRRGEGWRLMCAEDVLKAHEACKKSGKSVFLHFD